MGLFVWEHVQDDPVTMRPITAFETSPIGLAWTRAAISRLENGLTDNPTLVTVGRLARAVGKRLQIELVDE